MLPVANPNAKELKKVKREAAILAAKELKAKLDAERQTLEAETKAEIIRSVEERKAAILACNGDKEAIWKVFPSEENRKLLVEEISGKITKSYFVGSSIGRTYTVEVTKQGVEAFVTDTETGSPVKDSNGLNLIKFKKHEQILGLILKHKRVFSAELISDVFKLDSCKVGNVDNFKAVAQIFTFASNPDLQAVLDSFSTVQIKSENSLVYGTKSDGTLSVKERLIVADSTRNEVNGIKLRYKANLMLKVKAVNGRASETLKNAKKGLK